MSIKPKDVNFISELSKFVKKNKIDNMYTVGAILTNRKDILSYGLNDYNKTNPHTPQNSTYVIPTHAEVNCLSRYISKRKYLNDNMTLYIVGVTKSKELNYTISSRPCSSCLEYISIHGLKRIVYVRNVDGKVEIQDEYLE